MMRSRRNLPRLVLAFAGTLAEAARAQPGPAGERVSLRLDDSLLSRVPAAQRSRVTTTEDRSPEALALRDAIPPGRAVPVIYLVFGLLSIPVIYDLVAELLTRDHYGGVIIDLRAADPRITPDRSIPPRMVFVVDTNGAVTQYESRRFSEEILKGLLAKAK